MRLRINRLHLLLAFDMWWLLFLALFDNNVYLFGLLPVVAFISLLILPGLLTVIILRLQNLETWEYIGLIIGFSVLEIMFVGLVCNALLPILGVARPLDGLPIMGGISIFVIGLLLLFWSRNESIEVTVPRYMFFSRRRDLLIALMPTIFVAMSVVGACMLNNGGGSILTLSMLIGIGIYCALLIRSADTLEANVIPTALFFISLSLLLMTSLRGWFITGHDIQREYSVFQLTKDAGLWSIRNLRDAYNACMSITILPTILANLSRLYDPYIYKCMFQILFATMTPLTYIIVRRYVRPTIALLASLYFVAFPTFFTDMAFLNRQEIAFIFLALMFVVIFDERIALTMRRLLFILFGLGMILSHYSTTYTVIAMLIILVTLEMLVPYISAYGRRIRFFQGSPLLRIFDDSMQRRKRITAWMVVVLAATSFLWSSVLTDTSSNSLGRVIHETIAVMRSNTKEDAQSSDVLYSLFSWKKFDEAALLKEYVQKNVATTRAQNPANFYPNAVLEHYPLTLAHGESLPLTLLGKQFASHGLDVSSLNFAFRQASAKLLQLLIVAGIVAALLSTRFLERDLDREFVIMAGASVIMLCAIVVLPVLSVEYGLLRAFQQSLIFLSIFATIGSFALCTWMTPRARTVVASTFVIVFFWSSTGVFTQALGGYDPQLHLNNAGNYYDTFYTHESDLLGIDWLALRIQQDTSAGNTPIIQSDNFAVNAANSLADAQLIQDIDPAVLRKDAYVFLSYNNKTTGHASASYNSNQLTYEYPLRFLAQNKDLVYTNGETDIYK